MVDEYATWDAVETATRIRAGDVAPREVVEAAITRARAVEPQVNALVTRTFEQARTQAATGVHGPLGGVPTAVKDLDDVAGVPTSFGSRAFAGYVPGRTARQAKQFLGTGVISLGKSSTPEFGLTASTEPLGRPPTRNPWNLQHSVGGSSGGAAALVAASVVPLAFASDGGGSIRIPAACCGLVGLKPSRGRLVEMENMRGLPIKLAVHGVVTRTVRDTATYLAAAERWDRRPRTMPPLGDVTGPATRRLRIGVVSGSPTGRPVDADVVAAVRSTADQLTGLGHQLEDFAPDYHAELEEDFLLYWSLLAVGSRLLGRQLLGRSFDPDLLDPVTRGLIDRLVPWRAPLAIARLRAAAALYEQAFADVDVVLSPVTLGPAPPLGHLSPEVDFDTHLDRLRAYVEFTPVHNVTGAPAISLPLARSAAGLPIGVMLSGVVGDDRTLLELAYELEEAVGWPQVAPDLAS